MLWLISLAVSCSIQFELRWKSIIEKRFTENRRLPWKKEDISPSYCLGHLLKPAYWKLGLQISELPCHWPLKAQLPQQKEMVIRFQKGEWLTRKNSTHFTSHLWLTYWVTRSSSSLLLTDSELSPTYTTNVHNVGLNLNHTSSTSAWTQSKINRR